MRINKKINAIFIVLCVATGLFAGFSGSITSGFELDLDNIEYGFEQSDNKGSILLDLYGDTAISSGRGSLKAEVKAMLGIVVSGNPSLNWEEEVSAGTVSVKTKLDYARIYGPGFELGLLGQQGVPDYAKSAVDTKYDVINRSFSNGNGIRPYGNKYAGLYYKSHEYVVGAGFSGSDNSFNFRTYLETPKYTIGNFMFRTNVYATGKVNQTRKDFATGGSLKFGFYNNGFMLNAAADMDIEFKQGEQVNFIADAAASFYTDFGGLDFYYGTRSTDSDGSTVRSLLSARITGDFDEVGFPLRVVLTGKDLLAKQDLSLSLGYAVNPNLLFEISGGYIIATNGRTGEMITRFSESYPRKGAWNCCAFAEYHDKYTFDASAGVLISQIEGMEIAVEASASISSKNIIPGSEIAAGWVSGNLADKNSASGYLGRLGLSCTINF